MSGTPGAYQPGASRTVPVEEIASALAALWTQPHGEAGAVTRACALNLMAVAEGAPGTLDHRMASFPDLVAELAAEHPCRVFQVLAAPTAREDSLRASVSAHCHVRDRGERQVCCEQITLRATGSAAEHLHATIAPLLLGDLPTFLWLWDPPPFGAHRFERLARLADCLVVDTAHVPDGLGVVAELAAWSRQGEGFVHATAPGDLNYRRLWAWRERMAALFDPQERRGALDDLGQVEIRVPPGEPGAIARAVYLLGWLASRLGWQAQSSTARREGEEFRVEMDAGTHAVGLRLRDSEAGGGFAVRLAAGSGADALVASVETRVTAPGDASTISRLQHHGREIWRRQEPLPETSTAHLLMRELELGSRDRIYDEALAMAGDLARLWCDAGKP